MSPRERLARLRIGKAAAFAALLASVAAAPAAAQVMMGPGGPGGRQPLPLRSARTASFTATEGTWISLDVSPDGATIVFDLLGDLYTMPIEGGEASPLLTGMAYETQPRFSPDGESVTFISDRSGGDALWTMRLDLTDTTRVAGGGSSLMLSPEWSPDGVYIYQLYRYDRETGTTTTMTNRYGSAFRPAISPDGRWLVYGTRYNADTGLRKRDLETGEEAWLAYPVQRDEQESRAPLDVLPGYAFLPDGSAIVISYGGRIWNVPMDGSEATEIPFEAEVELDVGPQVKFEYQIDTTAMVTASQIRNPVVGPDGDQVVFTAFDRLWIRDLPDGEARRLTDGDAGEFHPQWSPDGRWIAYTTWDDTGGGHIMKVEATGGETFQLTTTAALYYNVAWSPNGERIVASRGAARQLKEASGAFFGPIGGEFVWVPAVGPEPAEAEVISPTGLRDVPHFAADDPDRIYAYSPIEGLVSFRWDGTDVKRHLIVRGRQGIAGIGDPHPNEWEFLPRRVFPWRQGPDPTDPDPPAEAGGPAPAGLIQLSPAGDRAFVQFGRDLFVVDMAEVGDQPPTIMLITLDSAPLPIRKVTDVGGEFPSWAPDGGALHWAMGNVLFTYDLDHIEAEEEEEEETAHARALLRVRAAAITDTLEEKRAEADSLENADEEVPEELEDEITRLQADSVQVVADSLLARADSIRRAAEEVAEKSAAVRAGDEEVLADTTETYEARERRIEAQLPRDVPRGTVALRGGRIITMTEVRDAPADTAGAPADSAGAEAPPEAAEAPADTAAAEAEEGGAEAEGDAEAEPEEPAMKPRIIEDGVVLVTDNRIVAVGPADSVEVPDSATVIDVSGKTLVPGFVDTHYHAQWLVPEVHPEEVWQYLATLSYGVTTTRDPQTATTDILSYTDRVRTGGMIGPRIYSTGPGVFAGENLRDADHAKSILRRYAEYFDTKTLKMYMTGNRQQRQWIIQAARDLELMPTTEGGLDYKIDITHAIDGYPGIEHNLPIAPIYSDVVELFETSQTTNSPTLLVSYGGPFGENYFYTHEDVLGDEKLATFVPQANIDARARRRGPGAGGSPGEGGWFLEEEYVFARHGEFVKKMLEADARMAVGSHGQIQGVGYHWELWAMGSGGASNYDILRAATILGAEAIGFGEQLGSIEEGKFADIVVLNSNPLDELRNTVDIHYVMKDGRLYNGMTLDEIYPEERPLERERPAEESAQGAAAGIRGNR
ncbi:amidohydrolase family protein [Candidatus Palauibacter sp.]|uniref:amidohydrolase family protein n=1 Tax=Candidatus Palauibacter sp. TaxID=3101350 RepID=UPI003B52DA7B